ncbi:unnamed protein product [Schistosoma mattheei]|uniref:Uncharacterized protein n=1 Tax=Schistosoma mattheei TaxID=31246 RepID=A0A183P0J4_9TREM|nr:unnamed protein product [Schistosoma mattheei]
MCDTSIECYTGLYKYLNDSTQLNSTIREELLRIYWEELNELKIQSEIPILLLIIIIIIFLIMILFGIFGSSLVIFIILNNRSMRTRGNLFILNLAISDLTLCLITQPFNLLRLLTNNYNWILGQFMYYMSTITTQDRCLQDNISFSPRVCVDDVVQKNDESSKTKPSSSGSKTPSKVQLNRITL